MLMNGLPRRQQQQAAELGDLRLRGESGGTRDGQCHSRFEYR
jgi:hypothetical protein